MIQETLSTPVGNKFNQILLIFIYKYMDFYKFKTISQLKTYIDDEKSLLNRSENYFSDLKSVKIKFIDSVVQRILKNLFSKQKLDDSKLLEFKFQVNKKEEANHKFFPKVTFLIKEKDERNLKDMQPFLWCTCPAFKYSGPAYFLWLNHMILESDNKVMMKPPEKDYNNKLVCKHLATAINNANLEKKVSDFDKSKVKQ
jgi:hypothetical protein